MSPPFYADLDKKCKDIFTKGYMYSFGLINIDCETKTSSGVELGAGFTYDDTGEEFGNLETKYKMEDSGITLSEKWDTDNVLVTEIIFEKPLVYELLQGVKTSLEATFAPLSGEKSGRIKLEYKQDLFAGQCIITDVLTTGCQCHLSGAVGQSGWLAGGQISYDTSSGQITKNSVGLGYDVGDLAIVGSLNDGQEFLGSVYHQVNGELQAGVQLACSGSKGSTARFGMGAKYLINDEMTVGGKVNNLCQLGLSFQRGINSNVTATVSALIEGKNLSRHGGHKRGLSLDVEI